MNTAKYVNHLPLDELPRIIDSVIPYRSSVNYLRLTIANNLSWKKQVTKLTSRISTSLYQLKLCKHLLPTFVND